MRYFNSICELYLLTFVRAQQREIDRLAKLRVEVEEAAAYKAIAKADTNAKTVFLTTDNHCALVGSDILIYFILKTWVFNQRITLLLLV